uniref:ANK_REP_REGION domain-containing protein n=1 Tax=Macrostomum lignano TaxID=282301 RepID=A0A1I8G442_9PLAT
IMAASKQIRVAPVTLEDSESGSRLPEQDSVDDSGVLDNRLSLSLAALIRRDRPDKLAAELELAQIPPDRLLHHRLTFNMPSSSDAETESGRMHHLAVHYSAGRTLEFLVRKTLTSCCCWKSLAVLDDADGSNLLHSLAKARVLREGRRGGEPSEAELQLLDEFESGAFKILAEVGEPNCSCDKETAAGYCGLPVGTEQPKSFLHALCLMENKAGLRPIEFAMQIGAYSTFQKIAEVDNYIKIEEHLTGTRVYKKYNLSEYDVTFGVRRSKTPILMLNETRMQQVPALRRSNLMQAGLLVDKWINTIYLDMRWTYLVVSMFFGFLLFQLTPLTFNFKMIVAMAQHAYELDKGFDDFANEIKEAFLPNMNANANSSNARNEDAVRSACPQIT